MIIFGTRGVTYSKDKGDFTCPSCGGASSYNHKRVRRFFTLYFIPLIPLDMLGEYVECQSCSNTFQKEVLDYDPAAAAQDFQAEYQRVVKRVMVQMLLADGVIDDQEIETVRDVYRQVANVELSQDDVRREIQAAGTDGRGIRQYLESLVGNLNDAGKETVVQAALMIAAADGEFQEEEKHLLGQIGAALDMTPAHLNGVVSGMLSKFEQAN